MFWTIIILLLKVAIMIGTIDICHCSYLKNDQFLEIQNLISHSLKSMYIKISVHFE